jgi:hypothetical protein
MLGLSTLMNDVLPVTFEPPLAICACFSQIDELGQGPGEAKDIGQPQDRGFGVRPEPLSKGIQYLECLIQRIE